MRVISEKQQWFGWVLGLLVAFALLETGNGFLGLVLLVVLALVSLRDRSRPSAQMKKSV